MEIQKSFVESLDLVATYSSICHHMTNVEVDTTSLKIHV